MAEAVRNASDRELPRVRFMLWAGEPLLVSLPVSVLPGETVRFSVPPDVRQKLLLGKHPGAMLCVQWREGGDLVWTAPFI